MDLLLRPTFSPSYSLRPNSLMVSSSSTSQIPLYAPFHEHNHGTNYHSDDSSFFDAPRRPHQRGPPHPSPMTAYPSFPVRAPHATPNRPGSMHIIDPLHPPSIDAPPPQKKRPRYTRSKAGCLTCRGKKIKVSHNMTLSVPWALTACLFSYRLAFLYP